MQAAVQWEDSRLGDFSFSIMPGVTAPGQ